MIILQEHHKEETQVVQVQVAIQVVAQQQLQLQQHLRKLVRAMNGYVKMVNNVSIMHGYATVPKLMVMVIGVQIVKTALMKM